MRITIYYLTLLTSFLSFSQSNIDISDIKSFQNTLNTQFKTEGKSPLNENDRRLFKGLDFFEIDLNYRVKATLIKSTNEKPFKVNSISGDTKLLLKYADLKFKINDKSFSLSVYQVPNLVNDERYKNYLFLPFYDNTNGFTTYGGGRYIDLEIPETKTIVLDFNKAYNPYCAYSDGWNCTIPPLENSLDIEIKAGVKAFKKK